MKHLIRIVFLCVAAAVLPGPSPASANPAQAFDNAWKICAEQTARVERQMGIPRHLLTAISLAESGRRDEINRANVAWPWTVTAQGRGRFFDTKAEAVAEVEILMTEGVRNIDVGCMQVNMYYHGGAFEGLDEAFDPRANTAYAAAYLKNMYLATGDWADAAGYYHSTTPSLNEPYKRKVLGFLNQQGGGAALAGLNPDRPAGARWAPIDYGRMGRLNARLKARRDAERDAANGLARANALAALRLRQLDAWRNATSRGRGTQHLIAMRRAELELKRRRELKRLGQGGEDADFAARRARQLREWRMKVAGRGVRVTPASRVTAAGMAAGAAGAAVR